MKISVLICNYNYAEYLEKCIKSALAQSYEGIEIVVVDDGSTDNSADVLSHFGDSVDIHRKMNEGQLSAFIEGLQHCSGEYVFLLDSDDYWGAEHISGMVKALIIRDKPDIAFSSFVYVDRAGQPLKNRAPYKVPDELGFRDYGYSYMLWKFAPRWMGLQTSTIAIKRDALFEILKKCSAFTYRFKSNADDVIVIGADLLGLRKVFVSNAEVFYRVHDRNAWHNAHWSAHRYYSRYIGHCQIFDALKITAPLNPCDHSERVFLAEFRTKFNVPFDEAFIYMRLALAHGKLSGPGQALGIFAHWRAFGVTQNRVLRHLLKRR